MFAEVESGLDFVMVHSYSGYTTNLPHGAVLDGQAWIAYGYGSDELDPEHGGPAHLLLPHLYFWMSAKWIRGLVMQSEDNAGFWQENGYYAVICGLRVMFCSCTPP